jgi:hypothetical protein
MIIEQTVVKSDQDGFSCSLSDEHKQGNSSKSEVIAECSCKMGAYSEKITKFKPYQNLQTLPGEL